MSLAPSLLSRGLCAALAAARPFVGASSPNPPVGAAALDARGEVILTAAHEKAGQAHAEAKLIEMARSRGVLENIHTLCVTLEPCNHQGRTPPCTEAIIAAHIPCVAFGTSDPNPSVAGGGAARLREAGIEVISGVEESACCAQLHAFIRAVTLGRPFVTVKRAFDANGSMIPPKGKKTFTGPDSLCLAHRLRKKADAILTGSGTILADQPLFTVRHVPDFPEKKRILAILDRRGRVDHAYQRAALAHGLQPIVYTDLAVAMADLAAREVRDVLVEAGPLVSEAVLASGLWDLDLTIRQGDPDRIATRFNETPPLPFAPSDWDWGLCLPE